MVKVKPIGREEEEGRQGRWGVVGASQSQRCGRAGVGDCV